MCLLKNNPIECNSDVSLFIKPNDFLFEMCLISLTYHYNPPTIFSGDFSGAEVTV